MPDIQTPELFSKGHPERIVADDSAMDGSSRKN
jgi:hypothetical protein